MRLGKYKINSETCEHQVWFYHFVAPFCFRSVTNAIKNYYWFAFIGKSCVMIIWWSAESGTTPFNLNDAIFCEGTEMSLFSWSRTKLVHIRVNIIAAEDVEIAKSVTLQCCRTSLLQIPSDKFHSIHLLSSRNLCHW